MTSQKIRATDYGGGASYNGQLIVWAISQFKRATVTRGDISQSSRVTENEGERSQHGWATASMGGVSIGE